MESDNVLSFGFTVLLTNIALKVNFHVICDTDYVRFALRPLFQRIAGNKYSVIGKHLQEDHNLQASNLEDQFTVRQKCRSKFDCLVYELLCVRT